MKMKELLVIAWAAKINSGWYKQREIEQGVEGGGWRKLTDEEKLNDSVQILDVHVHDYMDLMEKFGSKTERLPPNKENCVGCRAIINLGEMYCKSCNG